MDGPDALEQSCARLEQLAANAEIRIRELRVRAALRLVAVVGMSMTALLGCVVALVLTWDGPYRLTTAILLWGAFAIGTLYLRARLEREEQQREEQQRPARLRGLQARWHAESRDARQAARWSIGRVHNN